jgi:hypothetical protein
MNEFFCLAWIKCGSENINNIIMYCCFNPKFPDVINKKMEHDNHSVCAREDEH